MDRLHPGIVAAHVVHGPQGAECRAARRQLPDEVGQLPVRRVPTGLRVQDGDHVPRHAFPVEVEVLRTRVEEGEPRAVHRLVRAVEVLGVEVPAEAVGGVTRARLDRRNARISFLASTCEA